MNLKKNVKNVNGVYATLNNVGGKTMEWNVYYYDYNSKEMHTFNVFEHYGFRKSVRNAVKESKSRDEFAEKLIKELNYHFVEKSEWEIVIAPWTDEIQGEDIVKIDVYDQVMLNYDKFVDTAWYNRRELFVRK